MYVLISGERPFEARNKAELLVKVNEEEPNFDKYAFNICSKNLVDLIKKLLEKDPKKRISAINALKHPWFDDMGIGLTKKVSVSSVMIQKIANFEGSSVLKKAACNMLIRMSH